MIVADIASIAAEEHRRDLHRRASQRRHLIASKQSNRASRMRRAWSALRRDTRRMHLGPVLNYHPGP